MKTFFTIVLVCISFSLSAQNKYLLSDNFDSNQNGWSESVSKKSKAIIQDGFLLLESKSKKDYAKSTAFLGVSLKENFELSCKCTVKEVKKDACFGLVFNEENENNFYAFLVKEGEVSLWQFSSQWKCISTDKIKLRNKKNQELQFEIKNVFGTLTFYVNGMEAIKNIAGKIDYSGFGFVVLGEQTAKFDDLRVIQ